MELKIEIDNNLAKYIDIEELQNSVENDIEETINYEIQKLVKNNLLNPEKGDNLIISSLTRYIMKTIFENAPEMKKIEDKLKEVVENRIQNYKNDPWEVSFTLRLDDKIRDLFEKNAEEYNKILESKINKTINELDSYFMRPIITDYLSKYLVENCKYKKDLEDFFDSNLDNFLDYINEER